MADKTKTIGSPGRRLTAEEREEAVRLRLAGLSYAQIGDRLGVTRQAAFAYVSSSLADLRAATAEAAEDVREMELARLDAMLVPMLEAAEAGQQTAVDRVLRIQERRAKLLGLDAAEKHETNLKVEGFELDLRRGK